MSLMVKVALSWHRCDRYRSEDYDDDDDDCYSFTPGPSPCESGYEYRDRDSKGAPQTLNPKPSFLRAGLPLNQAALGDMFWTAGERSGDPGNHRPISDATSQG